MVNYVIKYKNIVFMIYFVLGDNAYNLSCMYNFFNSKTHFIFLI